MFEQIIAFTLHLSISMWVENGWGYHYDVVNINESERKKSGFPPFSLYGCSFLMMIAIKNVNLTLISRTIFQSMSSLSVHSIFEIGSSCIRKKKNHSEAIRWKWSGRWWNENTFFCHRMFNDPKRERLTIIFLFFGRSSFHFSICPSRGAAS